jgi:hypothetical protein
LQHFLKNIFRGDVWNGMVFLPVKEMFDYDYERQQITRQYAEQVNGLASAPAGKQR